MELKLADEAEEVPVKRNWCGIHTRNQGAGGGGRAVSSLQNESPQLVRSQLAAGAKYREFSSKEDYHGFSPEER